MHNLTLVFLKIIQLSIRQKKILKQETKKITLQQKQTRLAEQNKLKLSLAYVIKRHGLTHKVNHYYYLSQEWFRIIFLQFKECKHAVLRPSACSFFPYCLKAFSSNIFLPKLSNKTGATSDTCSFSSQDRDKARPVQPVGKYVRPQIPIPDSFHTSSIFTFVSGSPFPSSSHGQSGSGSGAII